MNDDEIIKALQAKLEKACELLYDASEKLENAEYTDWYNASTCTPYKDWRSKYTLEFINSLRTFISEVEGN